MANKRIFIDTSYVYALVNPNDQWHSIASEWQRATSPQKNKFITSEFVLTEIADGLSSINYRKKASHMIRLMLTNPDTEVILASTSLFRQALELYEDRDDKNWGLTDCSSFVVMREYDITDVLTTDGHFQQAGFNPLLNDLP